MVDNKAFGGNIILKFDIRKAFDTIDWSFLLKFLASFGFDPIFCRWIDTILQSAKLSFSINGKSGGFFSCKRGVRQGDPLSPLLFFQVPSHTLYVDDVMVFCKGGKRNLANLMALFQEYGEISGQLLSLDKCKFYTNSASVRRSAALSDTLGFNAGQLPFVYLGVPLFEGKPRKCHLQPIADKIRLKLASWKGSLLSIMGRIQLVKSIIRGMLSYSFHVYAWPVSLLKLIDKWIRNFIWSGDILTKKVVTVAWSKLCCPTIEGGVGLRSIRSINESSMLKLAWEACSSNQQWSSLIRARFFRNGKPSNLYLKSTIWPGIKSFLSTVLENSSWLIGSGVNIRFWTDRWLSNPIVDLLDFPESCHNSLQSKVADFICDGKWNLPMELVTKYPALPAAIDQIVIPKFHDNDYLVWDCSASGNLSFKDAYTFLNKLQNPVTWGKLIWNHFIPPSRFFLIWRVIHNKLPTDENLKLRGCTIVSICCLCGKSEESTQHLFFNCDFALSLWNWFSSTLGCRLDLTGIKDLLAVCNLGWSSQVRDVVLAGIINIVWYIWYSRNKLRSDNKIITARSAMTLVSAAVSIAGMASKGTMSSSVQELLILKKFTVSGHLCKAPIIREVHWHSPLSGWIKCNTDGAAHGSPGLSAGGGILEATRERCWDAFHHSLELLTLSMLSSLLPSLPLKLPMKEDGTSFGLKQTLS